MQEQKPVMNETMDKVQRSLGATVVSQWTRGHPSDGSWNREDRYREKDRSLFVASRHFVR